MNISTTIYSLSQRFGDFKAVEIAKEIGFDAIDYPYYSDNECEEILGDGYREYAQKLRAHLDKVGIVCNQAHAPISLRDTMEKEEFEQKRLWIARSIESAAILGAKSIVVHSLVVHDKDVDFEEYNIEFYKSFIPYCEKFGIQMAVENMFRRDRKRNKIVKRIGSPEELNHIIEKLNSPWVVACVDTGHASLTGYEPEEFIEGMSADVLKAVHIQDTDYLDDRHYLPYTGKLNWEATMRALKKIGYTGDLTFEVPGFLRNFPDDLLIEATKFMYLVGKHLVSIYEQDI